MVGKTAASSLATPLWFTVALQLWSWYRSERTAPSIDLSTSPCSCVHEVEPLEAKIVHTIDAQAELRFQLKLTVLVDLFIALCLLGLACCGSRRARRRVSRRESLALGIESSEDEGGGLHLAPVLSKQGLRTPSSFK